VIRVHARFSDGISSLTVEGHEDHHEQGRVCAAVSAIVSTAVLGLQQIAQQHPDLVTIDIEEFS